jgi:aspartyl-tRNA synthetase
MPDPNAAPADLREFYRRYITRCNAHRFDELGEFVDDDVRVNDSPHGLGQYDAGLRELVGGFPDFHWELRHLLVDGNWLCAHLTDTGTHAGRFLGVPATGRAITATEFAVYRVERGKIVEVWGDLGPALRDQLAGPIAG